MSTFTDWNGPQGNSLNGLRNSDLLSLTKAYNDVLTALNSKQDKLTIDDTLSASSSNLVKNSAVKAGDDRLQTNIDNLRSSLEASINSVKSSVTAETTDRQSNDKDIKDSVSKLSDSFSSLSKDTAASLNNTKKQLEDFQKELNSYSALFDTSSSYLVFNKAIKLTDFVLENSALDFSVLSAFRAPVISTERNTPVFVLGMLSDDWTPSEKLEEVSANYKTKAGRAFIKFVNSKSFDALVDMSASYSGSKWNGALTVTGSNVSAIENLRVRLVAGTDGTGKQHVWLGILSGNWTAASPEFYQQLFFYASGINFLPVGSKGYQQPNDQVKIIAETSLGNGFSTAAFSSDKITDSNGNVLLEIEKVGDNMSLILGDASLKGIRFYTRPYYNNSPLIALSDIKKIITEIGTVVAWCKFDDEGKCVGYPDNYLPCDGSTFDRNEYPELFQLLGGKLPLVDYHLVKAKYGPELYEFSDIAGDGLEHVIATLHGINVYTNEAYLPTNAKVGVPAILKETDSHTGDTMYRVLVKTSSGWENYNTEFDDYQKTITSLASVVSSLHGSDVFTLYDNVYSLPSVAEEGELAIVAAGPNMFDTYKYVDGVWRVQV